MNRFMRFTLMVLLTMTLSACAELQSFEIQRTVEDNQLYSSFPELKVKIGPGLPYIGSAESKAEETSVRSNYQESTASYLFGRLDPGGILQKGILIRLTVVRGDPSKANDEQIFQSAKNPLDSGIVKILNDEYDYLLYTRNDFFTEEEKGILKSGSTAPCNLIKLLEKEAGLGNKSLVQVFYFEDASSECLNVSCDACLQGTIDESTKKEFLGGFDERSYQAISFMEPKKIVDATSRYVKPENTPMKPAEVISPATKAEGPPESVENRLKVLKDLLDKNLITREDYEKKKAEILEGL